jgi:hypothetical protein
MGGAFLLGQISANRTHLTKLIVATLIATKLIGVKLILEYAPYLPNIWLRLVRNLGRRQ